MAPFACVAAADEISDVLRALQAQRIYCEDQMGGKMVVRASAVARFDLTGDGKLEWLVDEGGVDCEGIDPAVPQRLQGSAGTLLHVIVEGRLFDFQARSWAVVAPTFFAGGNPVVPHIKYGKGGMILLLGMSGVACNSDGATPCIEALVWSDTDKSFTSVRPQGRE